MTKKAKPYQSRKQGQPAAPRGRRAPSGTAGTDQDAAGTGITGPDDSLSGVPVVGIGGSAGALDPFKIFFAAMPVDSGAAFVVIQHLPPTHHSLLAELLAQRTRMKVLQAADGMQVEPNCVYVIPANQYPGIQSGVLSLAGPSGDDGIRLPIDHFFRSLAEDRKERAIGVLFSGAGSDGTAGVRAIRGAGGLTIAQEPQTAQFGDMPRSAVATGMVDFVLPPDQMPEALLNYLLHPYVRGGGPAEVPGVEGRPGGLQAILALILKQYGSDFRCYKKNNILRRIERRMGLHRIRDLAQYYALLRKDDREAVQLFRDLLINVTSFFRDAEAFEELRHKVIVPLVRSKQPDGTLRVWVVGCATGEEAYSLAMLLLEETERVRKNCLLQIFATDIDEDALNTARQGIYPESVAEDVGPERLARFFIRREHGYQISNALRRLVTFAAQNIVTDPPFSRMDLISCRNLLIYLEAGTQEKIIPLFNFALNPGGYLFLGKSEGVSGHEDLFDIVAKNARLYRRLTPARLLVPDFPILPGKRKFAPPAGASGPRSAAVVPADLIRHALLSHFAASVVLVDRKGQILQFHGDTGKYLRLPTGEPNLNLLEIAREGFGKLRAALYRAFQDGRTVTLDNVQVTRDKGSPFVRVTLVPTARRDDVEPLLAVIFEDISQPAAIAAEDAQGSETVVQQLEEELRGTQQELQATIQELLASNEELRVANEEVVSTNEELQSTVEELETSREELQSVNEELITVNNELREKVDRLDISNNDLDNFLKATDIATLFLDRELGIRFFTPATTRVLKLLPSDTGRALSDFMVNLTGIDLMSDARAVAGGAGTIERETRHADGTYYQVHFAPYHDQNDRRDGVVITFGDITRMKLAEKQSRRLAAAVKDSNDAVILFDRGGGKILEWNRGAEVMYGWSETEALTMTVYDITPSGMIDTTTGIIRRLAAGDPVASFESVRKTKDGRILDVWLTATAVFDETGQQVEAVATTERDITARKKTEEEIERLNKDLTRKISALEAANKEIESFMYSVSHDLRAPLRHVSEFARFLAEDYAGLLDGQGKDYLARIVQGTVRMSQLMDALLDLSGIARQEIRRAEIDLSSMASSIVADLSSEAPSRSVEVAIAEGLTAFADPQLMEVVLSNLFSNAWKFTSKTTHGRIEFGSLQREGKTVYYLRDNGAGFDQQFAGKMFLPFHRLHSAGEFAGTGIGLALTEKVIRRHGGTVWAEGEPGKGAVIYFTLE